MAIDYLRGIFLDEQYTAASEQATNAGQISQQLLGYNGSTVGEVEKCVLTQAVKRWFDADTPTCLHVDFLAPKIWVLANSPTPVMCCPECGREQVSALIRGDEKWRCDHCHEVKVDDCRDGMIIMENVYFPLGICRACACASSEDKGPHEHAR